LVVPITREGLNIASECVGFVSALALTWQSLRLVGHLRAVRNLRSVGQTKPGTKVGELADKGAETLERTVSRWDERDQWFVVIGLAGLALSFLLKLIAFGME
jgi:hypothetical protein